MKPSNRNINVVNFLQFKRDVFWLVRQSRIKDPAAWVAANPALMEVAMAPVAPVGPEPPVRCASFHCSRQTHFFIFTQPETEVLWLPEQLEKP